MANLADDARKEALAAWTRALVTTAEEIGHRADPELPADLELRGRAALGRAYELLDALPSAGAIPPHASTLAAVAEVFPLDARLLADTYERVLDYQPHWRQGTFALELTSGRRKRTGSYFTPPSLVQELVDHALGPVVTERLRAAAFGPDRPNPMKTPPLSEWSPSRREAAEAALLDLRVCDPACGSGNFLLGALDYLAERLLWLRFPTGAFADADTHAARHAIASHCLIGVDRDRQAVAVARQVLRRAVDPGHATEIKKNAASLSRVLLADSLGVAHAETGAAPPLDWPLAFPDIFDRADPGFDVVIGNPPFANAIEGSVPPAAKEQLGTFFPELIGTADLSFYFLVLAHRIARANGAVGLVLPRGILTARSARDFRRRLLLERPPNLIHAPQNKSLFEGADIFVTLISLKRNETCLGSRDADQPRLFPIQVSDENWWSPLVAQARRDPVPPACPNLGDKFDVFASMTTGMAYDLLTFVSDEPKPDSLRLVTTGLIDPGVCHWGNRACRYLKLRFDRPIIHERSDLPASVRARLDKVRRPKVLVAGLSTRIESFLDAAGIYCGAVSTFTILHPRDDVDALARLVARLSMPELTEHLVRELGAHAMSGGRITLSKEFLRKLPLS